MTIYRMGLDVGISSVGWSVLALHMNPAGKLVPYKILDLGVRIFEPGETQKGESLAAKRRANRSARRNISRHRIRMERIYQLLETFDFGTVGELRSVFTKRQLPDVYLLRSEALDRKLSDMEFARVLIHIAQRRGFLSNRKSELKSGDDTGKILSSVKRNQEKLISGSYRTVGEMLFKDPSFINKRNKQGDYSHTFSRSQLIDEINMIFDTQRAFGNTKADPKLQAAYLEVFTSQRNFDEGPGKGSPYGGDMIAKMVGNCTFEKNQKRAPKASYSFERFQSLQAIQNLRISQRVGHSTITVSLTDDEKNLLLQKLYSKREVKYSDLRKWLNLSPESTFKNLRYTESDFKKTENTRFLSLKFYHDMKQVCDKLGFTPLSEWNHDDLDRIGEILTSYKSDSRRRVILQEQLRHILTKDMIESLLELEYSGYGNLSFMAMRKIIPYMEMWNDYDQACSEAGYDFRDIEVNTKVTKLPAFDTDDITNPVVRRALSQARKVINAIIDKYGSPESIHIELARDIAKSRKERDTILRNQIKNRKKTEELFKLIQKEFGIPNPRPGDILKFRLFQEQQEKCMYSGESIERGRLFEHGYVEIDHIIPWSRSYDDSYMNKTLVKTKYNQEKGNRTPIEYLTSLPDAEDRIRWLTSFLEVNKTIPREKARKFVASVGPEDIEEFKVRNLSDTRYITVVLANHIRKYLKFYDSGNPDKKQRVVTVNGKVTAYLRGFWGLNKNRDESDLHHAQDAVVIGCTDSNMIQRVTDFDKHKKLSGTGRERFPEPWPAFRHELQARLSRDPEEEIRIRKIGTYGDHDPIHPIIVSRMARYNIEGPVHKETIRRLVEEDGTMYAVSKVKLTDLKLSADGEIDGYFNKEDDIVLYNALKSRLIEFEGNATEAFKEPFYKVSRDGSVKTPVRGVKKIEKITLGVKLHSGKSIAANENMIRVDVFQQNGKLYLIPIYRSDVLRNELPNRVITSGRPYSEWTVIDDTFAFQFSLFKNDLVYLKSDSLIKLSGKHTKEKSETNEGFFYFKGVDIDSGRISLDTPDNRYIARKGIKTQVELIKCRIDYLGNVQFVKNELRSNFQKNRNRFGRTV